MNLNTARIAALSVTHTSHIAEYRFIPRMKLIVDDRDTDSLLGVLDYNNDMYEIENAIKVRDWVFGLEKMTEKYRSRLTPHNSKDVKVIVAFHASGHYSFTTIKEPLENVRLNSLVSYIIDNFWPILHPEVFDGLSKITEMKWVLEKI